MPKVILVSQFALPYDGIGSWTGMYNYYLNADHEIDYLVSPEPKVKSASVHYAIAKDMTLDSRLRRKFLKQRYSPYLDALKEIIEPGKKYVIQVIENFGLIASLSNMLEENYDRNDFYIQFFYHGFPPYYGNPKGKVFFRQVDEFVMLTNDAYKAHMAYYTEAACRFSVLPNAVDRKMFRPLPVEDKEKEKEQMGVSGKIVFLWCSQARPKKGLDLILDVWKRIYKTRDDIVLWVVGDDRKQAIPGVQFFGRIPNDQVNKFYQMASIYLFPSLNQEGFGLTLIEALLCGNYCIASNNGGIPEVLNYGEYGNLVERPNFIEDWVDAINDALDNNNFEKRVALMEIPDGKYDMDSWSKGMNEKIKNAKISLS